MKAIERAFLIDDDKVLAFGAKRIMKMLNFCKNLQIFENGQDAIEHLRQINPTNELMPDVILLDLNMPVMDGWQFLEEFTKLPGHEQVRLYILTSSVDQRDTERVQEYKAVSDYLVKPVTVEMFKKLLLGFQSK